MSKHHIYGIQGGKGSFNEMALKMYLRQNKKETSSTVHYLYTADRVLAALSEGEITHGLVATYNSVGGSVIETDRAKQKYTYLVEVASQHTFQMNIRHMLFKHRSVAWSEVTQIMTHPQVLKQCAQTLKRDFNDKKHFSGEGNYIDHAFVAQQIATGGLSPDAAVIGPAVLGELYSKSLELVAADLQDDPNNTTHFMMLTRPQVVPAAQLVQFAE